VVEFLGFTPVSQVQIEVSRVQIQVSQVKIGASRVRYFGRCPLFSSMSQVRSAFFYYWRGGVAGERLRCIDCCPRPSYSMDFKGRQEGFR
jgi:hypothetical protein